MTRTVLSRRNPNPAKLIRFAVDALHAVFVRDQRGPTDLEWEFVDQLVLHYLGGRGPGSLFDTYEAFINDDSAATVEEVRHGMWLALLQFVRHQPSSKLNKWYKLAQAKEAEHEHQDDPAMGKKPTGVNPPSARGHRTCPSCGYRW